MESATTPIQADATATRATPAEAQVVTLDVPCPMCDYNLRGLTAPVCPECGYRFEWADVLDPKRHHHPYLFEHHPRRNVRSFFRTLTRDWHRDAFWRTLHPAQPSSPRRLLAYWAIVATVAMLPAVAAGAEWVWQLWGWWSRYRAVSVITLLGELAGQQWFWLLTVGCLFMALLPILSGATLQLFHQSMARARVKPVHAFRCAIYSGDVVFWFGLIATATYVFPALLSNRWQPWNRGPVGILLLVAAWTGLVNAARLMKAYRQYMQFNDARATVLASQLIVVLVALIGLAYAAALP